jgi:GxxExxY protein
MMKMTRLRAGFRCCDERKPRRREGTKSFDVEKKNNEGFRQIVMSLDLDAETERIATSIVDSALKVHRALGPGLLESVYEACLSHELRLRGLKVETQVAVPIVYEGLNVDAALRLDVIVNDSVVIELKAVEKMIPLYEAQVLSYLRLMNKRLGFLINFNVPLLKDGIRRIVL